MVDENSKFTMSDVSDFKKQIMSGRRVKHGDKEVENPSIEESLKLVNWMEQEASQGSSQPVSVATPFVNTEYI